MAGGSTDTLYALNCLFCNDMDVFNFGASVPSPRVNFQHITLDDCERFAKGTTTPVGGTWSGMNSLLANLRTSGTVPALVRNVANCPDPVTSTTLFTRHVGDPAHYLKDSTYRGLGTADAAPLDSTLRNELPQKTTYAPVVLPSCMSINGSLTLSAQVPRYASGTAPDLGYHYPALDYTVASVQEGPFWYGTGLNESAPGYLATFVLDYWPTEECSPPPHLDFRFSNLLLGSGLAHQFWSGMAPRCLYEFLHQAGVCSAMQLKMQDCSVRGGWLNLGEPDGRVIAPVFQPGWDDDLEDYCGVPIAGSVTLVNNLFDRVNLSLDPDTGPGYWSPTGPYERPTLDVSLVATNNLFRGGWLFLQPIAATEGSWVFENNLFDKVVFAQNAGQPLNFNHNAYWRCTAAELGTAQRDRLQPDAASDYVLDAEPPYDETGPLGGFYLQATTEALAKLIDRGSKSAGAVGLYHYTTRRAQAKEAGSTVDIGLHYVATTGASSKTPIDTDSDGIPDYVEDANGNGQYDAETETRTDSGTTDGMADAVNPKYDDVDLDGDGMVGAVERYWSKLPLVPDNPLWQDALPASVQGVVDIPINLPLAMVQDETDVEMQVQSCSNPSGFEESSGAEPISQGTGAPKFVWNTAYDPFGENLVFLRKNVVPDYAPVQGFLRRVTINNTFQVTDPFRAYGDKVVVEARCAYPNGKYRIAYFDENDNPLTFLEGGQVKPFSRVGVADSNGLVHDTWGYVAA